MTSQGLAARSPLHGVNLADGIFEVPFLSQINLRADPGDADTFARIGAALGVPPPTTPNTFSAFADGQVVWLGPNEWLIVGAPETATRLEATLRNAAADATVSIVDVSASRTTLSITGTHACA